MKMAKEREIERWITVNGARVPIFKGQSVKEAVSNFITKSTKKGPNQKKDNYRTPEQLQGLKEDAEEYARTGKTHDWSKEYISEVKDYLKKNPVRKESKFDEMMKWKTPEQVQALKEDAEDYAKTGKTHDWSPEYVNEVKTYLNHQKQAKSPSNMHDYMKAIREAKTKEEVQKLVKDSGNRSDMSQEVKDKIMGVAYDRAQSLRKDEQTKEKQIAQNKAEADRASGKNETVFGKEMNDKINTYQEKFLKNKTPEQLEEIKKNLEKGGNIVGYKVEDHVALAAIRREQESRQSSTGNKTSSGERTIQQMSAAQADGMRKLKDISSSRRFNEISFERPTTGEKLRVSVEKVSSRDYWGRKTGTESYTLNVWNESKTNEYGNHEKEYYNYGIKDMKEVKRIIKRYLSM